MKGSSVTTTPFWKKQFLQNFTFIWKVSKISQSRLVAYLGALFLRGIKANWSRRCLCLAFTEVYRSINFTANAPQRSASTFYVSGPYPTTHRADSLWYTYDLGLSVPHCKRMFSWFLFFPNSILLNDRHFLLLALRKWKAEMGFPWMHDNNLFLEIWQWNLLGHIRTKDHAL